MVASGKSGHTAPLSEHQRSAIESVWAAAKGSRLDPTTAAQEERARWAALGGAIHVVDTLIGNGDLQKCCRAEDWLKHASGLPQADVTASLSRLHRYTKTLETAKQKAAAEQKRRLLSTYKGQGQEQTITERPVFPQINGHRESACNPKSHDDRQETTGRTTFSPDTHGPFASPGRRHGRPIKRQNRAASWHLGPGGHLWADSPSVLPESSYSIGSGYEVGLGLARAAAEGLDADELELGCASIKGPAVLRAARWGDDVLLDKTMRRHSNSVNATDRSGATALIHAARNGHTNAVRLLLDRGALDYIDCRTHTLGWTAVHEASRHGHANCLAILLQRGAEMDRLSAAGTNPLMLAAAGGSSACANLLLAFGGKLSIAETASDRAQKSVRAQTQSVLKMADAMNRKQREWRPLLQRSLAAAAASYRANIRADNANRHLRTSNRAAKSSQTAMRKAALVGGYISSELVVVDKRGKRIPNLSCVAMFAAWRKVVAESKAKREETWRADAQVIAVAAKQLSSEAKDRLEKLHKNLRQEQVALREAWPAARATMHEYKTLLDRACGLLQGVDGWGWSALHYAANYGYAEVVKLLLAAGADELLDAQTDQGQTARQLAEVSRHFSVMALIDDAGGSRGPRRVASPAYRRNRKRGGYHTAPADGSLLVEEGGRIVWVKIPSGAKVGMGRLKLSIEKGGLVVVRLLGRSNGRNCAGRSKNMISGRLAATTAVLELPPEAKPGQELQVRLRLLPSSTGGHPVLSATVCTDINDDGVHTSSNGASKQNIANHMFQASRALDRSIAALDDAARPVAIGESALTQILQHGPQEDELRATLELAIEHQLADEDAVAALHRRLAAGEFTVGHYVNMYGHRLADMHGVVIPEMEEMLLSTLSDLSRLSSVDSE
eukprot:SAG31_NODE_270_length_18732_cov_9.342618_3_plen_898_part_00